MAMKSSFQDALCGVAFHVDFNCNAQCLHQNVRLPDERARRETIVTLGWIAERLRMGSASMVVHCLRQQGF
jgi:hypothetical protein